MQQEFDKYSKNYAALLDDTLKITGSDTEFFATAKLKTLARLFPDWVEKPIRFLDFGCGNGTLFKRVRRFFPKAHYTGTDLSDAMVKEAQSIEGGKDAFFQMDSESWKQSTYDLIFIANVFHHVPHTEHQRILAELRPLLAQNGRIVLWEHNPLNPLTRKIVQDCEFDKDAVLIPAKTMKRRFIASGFSEVKIRYTTFFPKALRVLLPLESWLEWAPIGGQYIAIGQNSDQSPAT